VGGPFGFDAIYSFTDLKFVFAIAMNSVSRRFTSDSSS
jgi:hypothetical protein